MLPVLLVTLIEWSRALGGKERLAQITSVHREAQITYGGLTGAMRVWQKNDGRYRLEIDLGPTSEVDTFDGHAGWAQEGTAPPHQVGGAELERAVSDAYLFALAQFFPERREGQVVVDDEQTITVRPNGGTEVTVLMDPATKLPRAYVRRDADRAETTSFDSWVDVDGVKFPGALRQTTGDPRFDMKIVFTKTELNTPIDDALFGKPVAKIAPLHMPAADVTVPFELTQNHIFFPLSVNGSAPSSFILDTGAEMTVIDRARAGALKLAMEGAVEGRGAGSESVEVALVAHPVVSFSGVELPLRSMASIPLDSLALREGRTIDGIAGYDLISRFTIAVDYQHRTLHFRDPATYTPAAAAHALPVTFSDNGPVVAATIALADGRSLNAKLLVDTGSRGGLILYHPFIDANRIDLTKTIEAPLGAGIGGVADERIGRVAKLKLGGFTLDSPLTVFALATKGGSATPDLDGSIGGELLRRFTVTIDYPRERLLLEPNAQFAEASEYDMSGMLLEFADAKHDRVVVKNVVQPSPASEAAIRAEDELRAIDGNPAAAMPLDDLRKLLREPGKRHVLTIVRDGKELEVPITTRRLV